MWAEGGHRRRRRARRAARRAPRDATLRGEPDGPRARPPHRRARAPPTRAGDRADARSSSRPSTTSSAPCSSIRSASRRSALLGELYLVLADGARGEPKLVGAGRPASSRTRTTSRPTTSRRCARPRRRRRARASTRSRASLFRKLVTRGRGTSTRATSSAPRCGTPATRARRRAPARAGHRRASPITSPARRVLVLIHASRSDTRQLVTELEAIARRAPDDLEVKARPRDRRTARSATGPRRPRALEAIARARARRISRCSSGSATRTAGTANLDAALAWYGARRASSRRTRACRASRPRRRCSTRASSPRRPARTQLLQQFTDELPAAEQALGVIALRQGRADEAAWYLRRATRRGAAQSVDVARADRGRARAQGCRARARDEARRALATWPADGELLYLAGLAHALAGERTEARARLVARPRGLAGAGAGARRARRRSTPAATWRSPTRPRSCGRGAMARRCSRRSIATRSRRRRWRRCAIAYQTQFLSLLGALGEVRTRPSRRRSVRACPIGRDRADVGARAGGAAALRAARRRARGQRIATSRGTTRSARPPACCPTRATAARGGEEDATARRSPTSRELRARVDARARPRAAARRLQRQAARRRGRESGALPGDRGGPAARRSRRRQPPRTRPRATFYVDNSRLRRSGRRLDRRRAARAGRARPAQRAVADGGERTLCLLGPGSAQCGDRGTVRQVYLHDGWSVTLHCPK